MEIIIRVIGYAFLFLIDLFLYFFLHSHFLFMTLVLFVVIPVISLILAYIIKKNVQVTLSGSVDMGVAGKYRKNEEIYLKLKVDNKTPFLCLDCKLTLKIENPFYDSQGEKIISVPLRALRPYEVEIPIIATYPGVVAVEINKIAIKDMMGLWYFKKNISVKKEFIILPNKNPDVAYDRSVYEIGMTESDESTKKGNDFSEVSDIREYIPGDALTNIHWKLTAKREQLMVKERTSMSDSQLVVLLELSKANKMGLDRAIEVAYSLMCLMVQDKITVNFMYWSSSSYDFKEYRIDYEQDLDEAFSKMFYEATYEAYDEAAMNMRGVHPEIITYVHVFVDAGSVRVMVKENA